jgi:hypothetical protein
MFNPNFINDLVKGQLSQEGYLHFLNSTSFYVRRYNWPKNIIISGEGGNETFWSQDDIKELTHQFFEWIFSKGKLIHLNKIPENYLSYYFSQMLISFVANKIKQLQNKQGLSFEKCKELVLEITQSDFITKKIGGTEYVFDKSIFEIDIKPQDEIEHVIGYLSTIPISEKTKHFKPLVKMAIEDIFNYIESPLSIGKLVEYVFGVFDQRSMHSVGANQEMDALELDPSSITKYTSAITDLLSGISKENARLISEYLFQKHGVTSLSLLAAKYNIPKSSLHHRIEIFRKKLITLYSPENEEDGLNYIQNVASALDKFSN